MKKYKLTTKSYNSKTNRAKTAKKFVSIAAIAFIFTAMAGGPAIAPIVSAATVSHNVTGNGLYISDHIEIRGESGEFTTATATNDSATATYTNEVHDSILHTEDQTLSLSAIKPSATAYAQSHSQTVVNAQNHVPVVGPAITTQTNVNHVPEPQQQPQHQQQPVQTHVPVQTPGLSVTGHAGNSNLAVQHNSGVVQEQSPVLTQAQNQQQTTPAELMPQRVNSEEISVVTQQPQLNSPKLTIEYQTINGHNVPAVQNPTRVAQVGNVQVEHQNPQHVIVAPQTITNEYTYLTGETNVQSGDFVYNLLLQVHGHIGQNTQLSVQMLQSLLTVINQSQTTNQNPVTLDIPSITITGQQPQSQILPNFVQQTAPTKQDQTVTSTTQTQAPNLNPITIGGTNSVSSVEQHNSAAVKAPEQVTTVVNQLNQNNFGLNVSINVNLSLSVTINGQIVGTFTTIDSLLTWLSTHSNTNIQVQNTQNHNSVIDDTYMDFHGNTNTNYFTSTQNQNHNSVIDDTYMDFHGNTNTNYFTSIQNHGSIVADSYMNYNHEDNHGEHHENNHGQNHQIVGGVLGSFIFNCNENIHGNNGHHEDNHGEHHENNHGQNQQIVGGVLGSFILGNSNHGNNGHHEDNHGEHHENNHGQNQQIVGGVLGSFILGNSNHGNNGHHSC